MTAALATGAAIALAAAGVALGPWGMTGHMAAHMAAVAVAAPLLAIGLPPALDPAARWPRVVTPWAAAVVELAIVWMWHLPALRAAAHAAPIVALAEQACFLTAGLLLWSAALRAGAAGVVALLLTSMHMTLLGALVGLAPRLLYPAMAGHGLADQQAGGVVMLLVGGVSYLAGGLWLLSRLLTTDHEVRA